MTRSDRADFRDFGNIMFEQLLDPVLERRGGRGTTGAGTLHLEIDGALVEAAIDDVAAIIGNGACSSVIFSTIALIASDFNSIVSCITLFSRSLAIFSNRFF